MNFIRNAKIELRHVPSFSNFHTKLNWIIELAPRGGTHIHTHTLLWKFYFHFPDQILLCLTFSAPRTRTRRKWESEREWLSLSFASQKCQIVRRTAPPSRRPLCDLKLETYRSENTPRGFLLALDYAFDGRFENLMRNVVNKFDATCIILTPYQFGGGLRYIISAISCYAISIFFRWSIE